MLYGFDVVYPERSRRAQPPGNHRRLSEVEAGIYINSCMVSTTLNHREKRTRHLPCPHKYHRKLTKLAIT